MQICIPVLDISAYRTWKSNKVIIRTKTIVFISLVANFQISNKRNEHYCDTGHEVFTKTIVFISLVANLKILISLSLDMRFFMLRNNPVIITKAEVTC